MSKKTKKNKSEKETEEISIKDETAEEAVEKKIFDDEEEEEEVLTFAQKLLRAFEKMGDLFMLNVYFTVSCLPIITIGAAFTALYTVTLKMVKNKEGTITKEYWNAFKANLKQGIIIWLIDIVVFVTMYLEYMYTLSHTDSTSRFMFALSGFEFLVLAFSLPLQFPLLSRYENSVGRILFNSLALAFSYPGTWFRTFFVWALPIVLYYVSTKALVYTWYLWGLLLSALFAYFCSTFLVDFFAKLESAEKN